MYYLKLFAIEILLPLIILGCYAWMVPKAIEGLYHSVKAKKRARMWGYSWGLFAYLYFFILMIKRCK